MVQKRPFDDDGEPNNVSPKQLRQLETNIQLVWGSEFPCDAAVQSPHASGEGDNDSAFRKCNYNEKLDGDCSGSQSCPKKEEASAKAPLTLPCSSWVACSTSEEYIRLEGPFHTLLSPDYYNFERPPRTHIHHGEAYGFLFDQPPRKLVPVGPDFQADIPEWLPRGDNRKIDCSEGIDEASNLPCQAIESVETKLFDYYEKQSAGSIIIPMPDLEINGDVGVGVGRTICCCGDVGSVRCVQQHILEAREKLKKMLGHETFSKLGFCDMGEVVAQRWSGEEEQLFHEVVFSNPASIGKNFWDHLHVEFPSRTMKEIVSYYFNVFILRKRAEQNRCDPMNIDSDNDEWQATDDSTDNEAEIGEYDDSVVESPLDPERIRNFDRDKGALVSTAIHPSDTEGLDGKDGPCASVDVATSFKINMEKTENCKWTGSFSGINGSTGHEFMFEACNVREWDVGYLSRPRNDVDLLPTCSMIEEVFGAGSWARDGR